MSDIETEEERKEEEMGERVLMKDTDRWNEKREREGFPGTCWGLWYAGEKQELGPGTMLWTPRGAGVDDVQNVMDPPTAEEPLGSRAESRCVWEGQRAMERCM